MEKDIQFITPDIIRTLGKDEIFVFGSNLAGCHGGGAARFAYEHFGAEWGVGNGMTGSCYAIPTMHGGVDEIRPYVDYFADEAFHHPDRLYYVTPIGCGIAGFTPEEIAPLFEKVSEYYNVTLPESFARVLNIDPKIWKFINPGEWESVDRKYKER